MPTASSPSPSATLPSLVSAATDTAATLAASGKTTSPSSTTCLVSLFVLQGATAATKDLTKPCPSCGFVRVPSLTTLRQLRDEIAEQLDFPAALLNLPATTTWENAPVSFSFLLQQQSQGKIPVAPRQEDSERAIDHPCLILHFLADGDGSQAPRRNGGNSNGNANSNALKKTKADLLAKINIRNAPTATNENAEGKEGDAQAAASSPQPQPLDRSKLPFKITMEPRVSCTGKVVGKDTVLVFDNTEKSTAKPLCNILRSITDKAVFYNTRPKIKQDALLFYIPKIKRHMEQNNLDKSHILGVLVQYLEEEFAEVIVSIKKMIADGQISFPFLWYLFPFESKFFGYSDGEYVGSTVVDTNYMSSFFGDTFKVNGTVIKSTGKSLKNVSEWFSVREFEGLKNIKDLQVQPMTDTVYDVLVARGKVFREVSLGIHYMRYSGNIIYRDWWSVQRYRADGRVMVDGASFSRFNPNYRGDFHDNSGNDDHNSPDKSGPTIADDKLFITWPTLTGFSFMAKKWGEMHVKGIQPIDFDDQAFNQLVLHESKKQLIQSLVTHSETVFSDIISGKGGGAIFLLHGPPGVGKTLTAEAISEYLHRPLYSISVGELGVTCRELEEKLSQILEMARAWRAVILIDEADIFLERRSDNDIERNALVGIFLRLLEYHQGILFLTTNRVKTFDEAFHSRISVALNYAPLDAEARALVWTNLLEAARVESRHELDIAKLAEYELNGRQIKTTIRLAQTLAKSENVSVNAEHVARCVDITKQFQTDIKGYDNVATV